MVHVPEDGKTVAGHTVEKFQHVLRISQYAVGLSQYGHSMQGCKFAQELHVPGCKFQIYRASGCRIAVRQYANIGHPSALCQYDVVHGLCHDLRNIPLIGDDCARGEEGNFQAHCAKLAGGLSRVGKFGNLGRIDLILNAAHLNSVEAKVLGGCVDFLP